MQIPDLTHMLVNVRVHEAMVSHLQNEDAADRSSWQQATIRVDAYPSRLLHGHIKTVDSIASQQDWFSTDVKVYKTMVSIDDTVEGLKPGMSAEVTITADESPNEVLIVPVQSVIGTISSGANRQCFVVDESGQPKLRDIVVGMSNQREVEVKSGLKEGERVVANPTPLIAEDSDVHPGKARTKPEDASDDSSEPGKKSSKKKKAAPAPPQAAGSPDAAAAKQPTTDMQAWNEKIRSSTPAERRRIIDGIADQTARTEALQKARDQGLEVAN